MHPPRTALISFLAAVLVAIAGAACGSGSDPADPDAASGTPDAGGEAPGFRVDRAGSISLMEGSGVYAALYDRAFEQPLPTVVATGGDCAVYHRPTPTCAAGCGSENCVADDQCAPFAAFASAGDLSITGLRQPLTLTPSPYGYVTPSIPTDFFADDAAIHVAAAGADVPAFTADVGGVAPLVDQLGGGIVIRDGEDKVVAWTADAGGARIQLALTLGWHGQPWTDLLLCETADDGALTIPAALIEAMPTYEVGLFQWPSWIARFRRSWVTTPGGPVEVIAGSQVSIGLSHPAP